MVLFLMLPGSPVPDWLILLLPLVVIVALIQGGQWAYKWYKNRLAMHHHSDSLPPIENIASAEGSETE